MMGDLFSNFFADFISSDVHFSEDLSAVRKLQLEETDQNFYPYLDKLFAYLAVINMHQEHVVIFVKTGAKICSLLEHIKPLLEQ